LPANLFHQAGQELTTLPGGDIAPAIEKGRLKTLSIGGLV
jgi:TRAP-type mannitol/chloroaromatic compound transport system substrate-binding protein